MAGVVVVELEGVEVGPESVTGAGAFLSFFFFFFLSLVFVVAEFAVADES